MNRFGLVAASAAMFVVSACDGGMFSGGPECGGDQALAAIDEILKEELEFSVESELDSQGKLGDYDSGQLENAVERIDFSLNDVRSSEEDSGNRLSCRATLSVDLPKRVESKANEALTMAEAGSVRKIANRYKMKRRSGGYTADLDYTVEQTDDGSKVFVDIEDDSSSLDFMGEVLGSFLLADEIREEKIKQDQAEAAEKRAEREAEEAFNAEGAAALNAAKVERKLASEQINAVWTGMPKNAQNDLDDLHSAWVQQMKAKCKAESAGSDRRASMREAKELNCQTRMVRSCANTLRGNRFGSRRWNYCRVR